MLGLGWEAERAIKGNKGGMRFGLTDLVVYSAAYSHNPEWTTDQLTDGYRESAAPRRSREKARAAATNSACKGREIGCALAQRKTGAEAELMAARFGFGFGIGPDDDWSLASERPTPLGRSAVTD